MTRRHPPPQVPDGLWDRPDMAEALDNRDMSAILTIYRRWTGATQTRIATMTGIAQPSVSEILSGKRQVMSLSMFERFAEGLDIPRARLGLAEPEPADEPDRRAAVATEADPTNEQRTSAELRRQDHSVVAALDAPDGSPDEPEELAEIGARMRQSAASNISAGLLDHLASFVDTCVSDYETTGPAVLMPHVVTQRRWVQQLLGGHQPPRQRLALYRLAARLSGLAGYMAVNRGRFELARAYCAEAFELALLAGDGDLAAWVRGTESLCEYYAGDPKTALDRARDGQRHARGGRQAIRLAVNGEARALGLLGDREGVREAVGRAYELAGKIELPAGMSSCISFGAYSPARIAANAATAHVHTGEPDRVRHYAETASGVVQASESVWSRALVALDVATALVVGEHPEPDHAAALGAQALLLVRDNPIESVRQRGRDLARRTAQWEAIPAIAELADLTRTLTPGTNR